MSKTAMAKTYVDVFSEIKKSIKTISIDDLKRQFDDKPKDVVLVDVREKEEVRGGYIPGSVHVPRSYFEMQLETKLPDKAKTYMVYCAGGTRSAFAARVMTEYGYERVINVNPGFVRWKDLGYPVEMPPNLTDAQRDRYSRHLLLPEVGERGQVKLLESKVLLLGAGGLGCPAAMYLAAAGVGTLGFVDADTVDASNLQRQVLHATSRIGMAKVDSAEQFVNDLNPDVKVVKYKERLTSENVDRIFKDWDVVIDGCDNFPTRYLVNDASLKHKIPIIHGSIFRFDGQVTTFVPFQGPCYRCLYPEPPPAHLAPSCSEAGVLGILPGMIGTLQATEAVKVLLGKGDILNGRLLQYDSMGMTFRNFKLRRDKQCPACGEHPTITEYIDYEGFCAR